MKLPAHAALQVSLRWQEGEGKQRVGRLAWRDQRAWFEFDADFVGSGLNPSAPTWQHVLGTDMSRRMAWRLSMAARRSQVYVACDSFHEL